MLRRAANDHILVFSIHHAIADGWSLGVFVQDLCTAYVMGLSGFRKAVAVGVMGSRILCPLCAKPTANGPPPSARSGSRRSWSRERLFGSRSSRAYRRIWSAIEGPDTASGRISA
jgi:hypothetical protein